MKFPVTRNQNYDFAGQSYADSFPNLHKYPATMIPQLGIEILKEFNITNGSLLDPYCGSGSSFASGLMAGLTRFAGYDINPLAILISKAKYTQININQIWEVFNRLCLLIKSRETTTISFLESVPEFNNREYWFSESILQSLGNISDAISISVPNDMSTLFWISFVETVRECSYTRNHEFKLYRIHPDEIESFEPDVVKVFINNLKTTIENYISHYYPLLSNSTLIALYNCPYQINSDKYDVVLTSPPYGDSKTTVAYGQYSLFANEWLRFPEARQVDKKLMGGMRIEKLYLQGVMLEYIRAIDEKSHKRALEVSAFYYDLAESIYQVSKAIKLGGYAIYVVGNRRVKDIQLVTDQFIAEQFEKLGFQHLLTYERSLSNKVMPSKNSPTNETGRKRETMSSEYIVVCKKVAI